MDGGLAMHAFRERDVASFCCSTSIRGRAWRRRHRPEVLTSVFVYQLP